LHSNVGWLHAEYDLQNMYVVGITCTDTKSPLSFTFCTKYPETGTRWPHAREAKPQGQLRWVHKSSKTKHLAI